MSLAKGSQLRHRANTTGILNESDKIVLKCLNETNEKVTDKVCDITGGRKGSIGHFFGEVYTPTFFGGFISAEVELALQSSQTEGILYFLDSRTNSRFSNLWNKSEFEGTIIYQRDDLIDLKLVDSRGRTNLQRMEKGLAPLGPDGEPINLHHLTQTQNGAIAEVEATFHQKYYKTIHINTGKLPSAIDRNIFQKWRRLYWRYRVLSLK
jgi:hypothetical protein